MTTPADHDKRCPAAWDTSVKCNCGAQAADEIALIAKTLESVGITSLLNHGAASCVFTEGCAGVSQDHILAYTRKIALHCAVALAAPPTAQAEGCTAEQALLKVLAAVQRYLPPDGPSAKDTLAEIIGIIDPWPLGDQKGKA